MSIAEAPSLEILDETALNADVKCASVYCRTIMGRPEHRAHYTSRLSCGHGVPVCRDRVAAYMNDNWVRCVADQSITWVAEIILTEL